MKNTADKTREEKTIEIMRIYNDLTPENQKKVRTFIYLTKTTEMSPEEKILYIEELYSKMNPENRKKALAYYNKLLAEQEGKVETNG